MLVLTPNAKQRILAMAFAGRLCANCNCLTRQALSLKDDVVLQMGEIAVAKDPALAPQLATILIDDGYDVEVALRQVRYYTKIGVVVLEVIGIVLKSSVQSGADDEGDSGPPVYMGDRDIRETQPVFVAA